MQKHIGYLNEHLYSDTNSYRVFEENGKLYVCEVEKIPAVDPHWDNFYCDNNYAVWSGKETKDIGKPMLLSQSKSGKYGVWGVDILQRYVANDAKTAQEIFDKMVAHTSREEFKGQFSVEYAENDPLTVVVFRLTPTGKHKRVFRAIADKIEDTCYYFHDYNF